MSNQVKDDLDAVRQLTDILTPFNDQERERIIRWVKEKLGMVTTQSKQIEINQKYLRQLLLQGISKIKLFH